MCLAEIIRGWRTHLLAEAAAVCNPVLRIT
jgi:hypothetical protein